MGRRTRKGHVAPQWLARRVCVVLSDSTHTLHLANLMGAVRVIRSTSENPMPIVEGPVDAIVEKARKTNPEFFNGRDVVGVLCAASDMVDKGTIVWVQGTKKNTETEEGADRI